MATGDPIDRAYLEVDGEQVYCESIDIDLDDKTDWVDAMTKDNEPLGVVSGNRHGEIKATLAVREDDEDDIDWIDLWEKKTNVTVVVEFENGRTFSFAKGVVSKPSEGAKHGDKATRQVELKCWNLVVS
jgi:hypothetical protein